MNSINKLATNPSAFSSSVSNIRKYHPLFMKFTFRGSGIILRKGTIINLNSYQILFKEGFRETLVYIVLYGKAIIRTDKDGVLGIVGIGESIGEEGILTPGYQFRL